MPWCTAVIAIQFIEVDTSLKEPAAESMLRLFLLVVALGQSILALPTADEQNELYNGLHLLQRLLEADNAEDQLDTRVTCPKPCVHGTCYQSKYCRSCPPRCRCDKGWEGDDCSLAVDECRSNPCQNGALCLDREAGYKCKCEEGYIGRHCENYFPLDLRCSPDTCTDAPCVPRADLRPFCKCSDGQHGKFCELQKIRVDCKPESNRYIYDQREGYITSPGYPKPYGHMDRCPFIIGSPNAKRIEIRFEDIDINFENSQAYLDYAPGGALDFRGGTISVRDALNQTFVINDDKVSVFFQSNSNQNNQKGFRMHYKITYVGCDSKPCQNGICRDEENGFICKCPAGYEGELCETNIDECASNPCSESSTCVDGDNGFSCQCAEDFTGTQCETKITPCSSNPCQNGICTDELDGFSCECSPGYEGNLCETDIDECSSTPCQNGAECVDGVNMFTCNCAPGYEGSLCQTDIDECSSNPCLNGVCHDEVNGFSCECSPGYEGDLCETNIDECSSNPCKNGGTCVDGVNNVSCSCAAGFTGAVCEIDIDECDSNPCQNGVCIEGVDSFTCECSPGYEGANCETNIDECASDPCLNGATCVDDINRVLCTCAAGFTGVLCETENKPQPTIAINACDSNPCQNGVCRSEVDGFSCECSEGFEGDLCDSAVKKTKGCTTNPCKNGICIGHGVNGFKCACSPGFEGTLCEINIDECDSAPCQNGAKCVDGINKVYCVCTVGFTGELCESVQPKGQLPSAGSDVKTQTSFLQVNLVTEYCVKKVIVHKSGDCTGDRLTGAVVRGGTSSTSLTNRGVCGTPLTAQQAEVRRSTVDFVCDPPMTAKFVTVDIPLLRLTQQPLCEVTIEQATPGPC
ncbi:fibropellin-1-like [Acanthaster planci]|uniref:Fibropellin-1-like n=1 Tax=Acanthaster planci TaxID=133434 RepID=A0A8B7YYX4_ACAPL|nr:fibropellin-1-like [Acanthaster planci]